MCLAEEDDTTGDERHDRDVLDAGDEAFVRAPPSDDPACSRPADDKVRALMETWVEGVRADAGLPAVSAAMYRRRRATNHRDMALEFAQRRKVAVGLEDDELCRSVRAAMDARVIGSCAYCGCNFSVVAAVDVPGVGGACGVCGRRVQVYDPAPSLVRDPPANAEERWKGWLPW
ncbi:hypothetical protein SETIT_2G254200v2 [Setaria italica]|uniref:Uncharacterized protein n=1 Tax=Setaria italica TaxID=4555 RepID=K4A257_SETIT|nr:hypothetical protein SETIT_2G254200v2 [Setaria italica]